MTDNHPSPEAVRARVLSIVEDALNSAIPEPWEVAEHATNRIMTLIPSPAAEESEGRQQAYAVWRSYTYPEPGPVERLCGDAFRAGYASALNRAQAAEAELVLVKAMAAGNANVAGEMQARNARLRMALEGFAHGCGCDSCVAERRALARTTLSELTQALDQQADGLTRAQHIISALGK